MPSFQIAIDPNRRAAARFVRQVRLKLQKLASESKDKNGISQSEVARRIGVHRSVISREINGRADMSLGRVAELAWALGKEAEFSLRDPLKPAESNIVQVKATPAIQVADVRKTWSMGEAA